jgi:AraC family transcriptional regulator
MVQPLCSDIEARSPTGSLFGEMIGDILAAHLPGTRLNPVLESIHANLDRNIHLEELASAAGVDAFLVANLITGCSPHQYLLRVRLDPAKQLLRDPLAALSDRSLKSDFADQRHLSAVFRLFVA